MMNWAAKRDLCRMIVVNKIDAPDIDLPGLLAQIQDAFGKECLPINLPAGGGAKVVDCFFNPSGESDFSSVAEAHSAIIDQVVEVDEDLMAVYLDKGEVAPERAARAVREGAARRPPGADLLHLRAHRRGRGRAAGHLRQACCPIRYEGNPRPFLRGEGAEAQEFHAELDPAKHVIAHVFKVSVDPFVGKLGVFKVHQGTVKREQQLFVGDGRKPFKVNQLYLLRGKDHIPVDVCVPGDIGALAKIEEIALRQRAARLPRRRPYPHPSARVARPHLRHRHRGDQARRRAALWEILQKLASEDPCLKVDRVATTNETVVRGLGELQVRCMLERLASQYKLEVTTHPPRIAYRETITAPAEGHSRHKKQTGGAGQFGEVFLRIEPLPRGSGFQFVDEVRGGAIPGQYIPAVEKGVLSGAGARGHRRLSAAGREGRGLRRQEPPGRLQGSGVRRRRAQGLSGRDQQGPPDRARADRQHPRQRAGELHRRHHRRSLVQARAGERHSTRWAPGW